MNDTTFYEEAIATLKIILGDMDDIHDDEYRQLAERDAVMEAYFHTAEQGASGNRAPFPLAKRKGREQTTDELDMNDIDRIENLAERHIPELLGTIWTMTSGNLRAVRRMEKIFENLLIRKRNMEFLELLQLLYALAGLPFPKSIRDLCRNPELRIYFLFSVLQRMVDCILDFQGIEY